MKENVYWAKCKNVKGKKKKYIPCLPLYQLQLRFSLSPWQWPLLKQWQTFLYVLLFSNDCNKEMKELSTCTRCITNKTMTSKLYNIQQNWTRLNYITYNRTEQQSGFGFMVFNATLIFQLYGGVPRENHDLSQVTEIT